MPGQGNVCSAGWRLASRRSSRSARCPGRGAAQHAGVSPPGEAEHQGRQHMQWKKLLAAVGVATASLAVAPAAGASPADLQSIDFNIVAKHSGKCLDVAGAGSADATPVQQWVCLGPSQTNQQWNVKDLGNGYHQIVNLRSGKCLDVDAFKTTDGAKVQQWTCNGLDNQRWTFIST
ncbi:RICIN domain-containing protein [Lentzea sp. NPDC006480]|uniref:RICIN domain-containing protein n=1 Tax=Lentzea sp. NPDC006480 TaxID=3157176 RepID=UPI0033A1F869